MCKEVVDSKQLHTLHQLIASVTGITRTLADTASCPVNEMICFLNWAKAYMELLGPILCFKVNYTRGY